MFKALSPILFILFYATAQGATHYSETIRKKHPVGSAWLPAVQRVYLPSADEKKNDSKTPVITSSSGAIKPVAVPQYTAKTELKPTPPAVEREQPTPEEMQHILSQLQAVLDIPDEEGYEDDQDFYFMPEEAEEEAFQAFLSALQEQNKQ